MALAHRQIEKKWQDRWEKARAFEAEVEPGKEKYFVTFPYPYMNGYLHIGHGFTLMRAEIIARYKKMQGFNVLFPFAFHCTGTPIVAAANRIKEGEPREIEMLKDMGISKEDIPKFESPTYWVEYFTRATERDVRELGVGVDWRRKFITTSLNPHYDKFIKWQFSKLKKKKRVSLGEHPVIWCPKCNSPVGDHDRVEGEGESPQEFVLLKFKCDDLFLLAATLRPETVFGQTNLWVNPSINYVVANVNGEKWVISKPCADKLSMQGCAIEVASQISGKKLIGKRCLAPGINREIPILPAKICDPKRGTGLVTSVPSDAPDDFIALYELKTNPEDCKRYGIELEEVKKIQPVPIIDSEFGDLPAVKVCKELDIKSHKEHKKLERAKRLIYKSGFYTGRMKTRCGKFAGKKVEDAKEKIKQELLRNRDAGLMYEPSGKVVCRCLTPCVVKVVKDQWFIAYGDKKWGEKVCEAIDKMIFYPPAIGEQLKYVVNWLRDWACCREFGLGTRLPWDKKWVIESLSDSTIYMCYYTISKYLQKILPDKVTDEVFDYVFLGTTDPREVSQYTKIDIKILVRMRKEFEYWYPFDLRVSGKDLVQNHLTFCLFNHVAVFPARHWASAYAVNGWILVDGAKMSKSAGNFHTLREVLDIYGADVVRISLAWGGEGIIDPNWDTNFVATVSKRLNKWYEFALANYNVGRDSWEPMDTWLHSILHRTIKETTQAMENLMFRTALKVGYFDLQTKFKWYLKRCKEPNKHLVRKFIETQTKILAPIVPHICEEIWAKLGFTEFISISSYPTYDAGRINPKVEFEEEFLANVTDDINEILKVIKIQPQKLYIYTAPRWMQKVYRKAIQMASEEKLELGALIKKCLRDKEVKKHAKKLLPYCKKLVERIRKMSKIAIDKHKVEINEFEFLKRAKDFLKREFKVEAKIFSCDERKIYDPKGRAKLAVPGRPGIYIEQSISGKEQFR